MVLYKLFIIIEGIIGLWLVQSISIYIEVRLQFMTQCISFLMLKVMKLWRIFLHSQKSFIIKMQKQKGHVDGGVFVIPNVTSLSYGIDPASWVFDQDLMKHCSMVSEKVWNQWKFSPLAIDMYGYCSIMCTYVWLCVNHVQ